MPFTRAGAQDVIAQAEPDDSLGTANATGLGAGDSGVVVAYANNGDGPYGPTSGDGTGDFDFFKLSANAGQVITVDMNNVSAGGDYDSYAAIYNSSGAVVAENDDIGDTSRGYDRTSLITYTVTTAGDYYVCASNWINGPSSLPGDPNTPGTGNGAPGGAVGNYAIVIGLDAGPVIDFIGGLNAGYPVPDFVPTKVPGTSFYEGTVTIRNHGRTDYVLGGYTFTGDEPEQFSTDLEPQTIAPGAEATFTVTFDSKYSRSVASATLDLQGNDALGFDYFLQGAGGPVRGGGKFTARQIHATGVQVSSLATADSIIAGNNVGSQATQSTPVVNYSDAAGGNSGNFANDATYFDLAGSQEDFVLLVTGQFFIHEENTYTFAVNSDDGQRLRIDGMDVVVDDTLHGATNFFGSIELEVGLHTMEYVMFERGGGAAGEVSIAQQPGTFTAIDQATWELLEAAPVGLIAQSEPDDSIPTANETGLEAGQSGVVQVFANGGDGPYGPLTGDGTGDFDFFKVSANAGQVISVDMNNLKIGGDYDPFAAIYDSDGNVMVELDDIGDTARGYDRTPFLNFLVTEAGDYYVCASNWINAGNLPTDPFTEGTGLGAPGGTPGDHQIVIGLDAGPVIDFIGGLNSGYPVPNFAPTKVVGTTRYEGEVTIRNHGTSDYVLNGYVITGPDAAKFSTALTAPQTIAPGAEISFDVVFDSMGEPDLSRATLELDGNDALDFDYSLEAAGSLVQGGGRFTARQVHAAGIQITTLAGADDLLAGNNVGSEATERTEVINYSDATALGNFPDDRPYFDTAGSQEDFVLHATGPFTVLRSGIYTFVVNSDDGQRLRIDGNDVVVDDTLHGATNFFGSIYLEAGEHELDYIMFERGGGAAGEVGIAQQLGTFTDISQATWELLESYSPDADGDGMPNDWEEEFGLDPDVDDSAGDLDGDTLTNLEEYTLRTDPTKKDTDLDGLDDNVETNTGTWVDATNTGTDPLDDDSDGDSLLDGVETNTGMFASASDTGTDPNNSDSDGDQYSDGAEVAAGKDPTDANSFPSAPIYLGNGTGALLGGDLTDPEDDGDPEADFGYNAIFAASEEEGFGGGEFAYNVFDNAVGGGNEKWCCGNAAFPYWVQATFEEPIVLTHFTISSANDTPDRDPRVWEIQGSNDGTNFTTIFRQDDPMASIWGTERLSVMRYNSGTNYTVPDAYTTIRFICFSTGLTSGARYQLGELEFFGEPAAGGVFQITNLQYDANNDQFTLTWNSRPNRTYSVLVTTDLETILEIDDGIDSEGDETSYTLANPNPGAQNQWFIIQENE